VIQRPGKEETNQLTGNGMEKDKELVNHKISYPLVVYEREYEDNNE